LIAKYIDTASGLEGTYWGITTKIGDYAQADSIAEDNPKTRDLRNTDTVLSALSDEKKGQLVNWGYSLTDSALKSHCGSIISNSTNAILPISDCPLT